MTDDCEAAAYSYSFLVTGVPFVETHFKRGFPIEDVCPYYGISLGTGIRWVVKSLFNDLDREARNPRPWKLSPEALKEAQEILMRHPDTQLEEVRRITFEKYGEVNLDAIHCAIVDDFDFSLMIAEKRSPQMAGGKHANMELSALFI